MTKLSNCYPLLPLPTKKSTTTTTKTATTRRRGRNNRQDHELRQLILETSKSTSYSSSNSCKVSSGDHTNDNNIGGGGGGYDGATSTVQLGQTQVMCQVNAPVPSSSELLPPNAQISMDSGTLYVDIKYAPNIGYPIERYATSQIMNNNNTTSDIIHNSGRIHSVVTKKEMELSNKVHNALKPIIPLQQYAKCAVIIKLFIIQDDGNLISTCLSAACLALSNAHIELYDLVCCCTVAIMIDDNDSDGGNNNNHLKRIQLLADPTYEEEMEAHGIVTLAIIPSWKEVTLWETRGKIPADTTNDTLNLCRDGCRTMHKFIRNHLISN